MKELRPSQNSVGPMSLWRSMASIEMVICSAASAHCKVMSVLLLSFKIAKEKATHWPLLSFCWVSFKIAFWEGYLLTDFSLHSRSHHHDHHHHWWVISSSEESICYATVQWLLIWDGMNGRDWTVGWVQFALYHWPAKWQNYPYIQLSRA